MKKKFNVIIVGSGPSGLGAAFHLIENNKDLSILIIDKSYRSSGGLFNDCKLNFTYDIGMPKDVWTKDEADPLIEIAERHLQPIYCEQKNIDIYEKRANKLGVELIRIKQSHVGTDKSPILIDRLVNELKSNGVNFELGVTIKNIVYEEKKIISDKGKEYFFEKLLLAPGRCAFKWLQECMDSLNVSYVDNIVDIGIRIEAKEENYSIVKDYYDPKFKFTNDTRTFCTNSFNAHVVKEKYEKYKSVNGHAFSSEKGRNGLVNFALLKTVRLTDPVTSGQEFAGILGQAAMKLGGGKPIMQRVGDFMIGKRSKIETFNCDLYDFEPTLKCNPGDLGVAVPYRIMLDLWKSLQTLNMITPNLLSPNSILYYPEIKCYANKPQFIDKNFQIKKDIWISGDSGGCSRGVVGAWISGIRAAIGILK